MELTNTGACFPVLGTAVVLPGGSNSPNNQDDSYSLAVGVLTSEEEFLKIRQPWQRLEQESFYCNIAYGYAYLTSAIKHLASSNIKVLAVEQNFDDGRPARLVGIIPIEEKRLHGLPLKAVELWKHDHCFDATPLLAADVAAEAWTVACRYLFEKDKVQLISMDTVSAEPEMEVILTQTTNELSLGKFRRSEFARAALRPLESSDEYRLKFWSKNMRREQRKLERRLADNGEFRFEQSSPESDFGALTEDFLRLEHSGWKGAEGTSLKSNSNTESFFRALIQRSAQSGNVRFVSLILNEKRIAMLSDFRVGNYVYSYKSAYDDAHKDLLAGKICEMKNVDLLHQEKVDLADSCTSSDNQLLNRIWAEKLKFQSVVCAANATFPRAVVKLLPALQSLKQKIKPGK